MKSEKAKVLHSVAGRPMILYVVETAARIAGKDVIVVTGTQSEAVKDIVSSYARVSFAYQARQLGTGHAAWCALPALGDHIEHVVVLCGDAPLIAPETLSDLIDMHIVRQEDVTVLGAQLDNPGGYGRLKINADGAVERIVEEADATEAEKSINTVNTGIYCVARNFLEYALKQIDTNNAQEELYLTDIVSIASESGKSIGLMLCRDNKEMLGINNLDDLEKVEAIIYGNEKP
ncbi:MAG: NTP transferase domain-containing protein [Desulfobacterales bacterium]|nr:NTP transferase domain-containing protein [Desulfobacterales bacterium]